VSRGQRNGSPRPYSLFTFRSKHSSENIFLVKFTFVGFEVFLTLNMEICSSETSFEFHRITGVVLVSEKVSNIILISK
jgi:hypothetical protein